MIISPSFKNSFCLSKKLTFIDSCYQFIGDPVIFKTHLMFSFILMEKIKVGEENLLWLDLYY